MSDIAHALLASLSTGGDRSRLADLYHPESTLHTHPNRLVPAGSVADYATILANAERGRSVVADERYELVECVGGGDRVALRVDWSARLLVPLGTTPVGGTIRADFAMFLELREGRIFRQHTYDCFHPF